MQFYRRWQPVAAISFDLDDTLYDNGPAIARAEQWMLDHLRSANTWLPPCWTSRAGSRSSASCCWTTRRFSHDVSLTRQRGIREALGRGMEPRLAEQQALAAFTGLAAERSKIEVRRLTPRWLVWRRYPLAVITNGNLDLEQAGLAGYFTLVCKAGAGARMKPAHDMFVQVQEALRPAPGRILHVGITR